MSNIKGTQARRSTWAEKGFLALKKNNNILLLIYPLSTNDCSSTSMWKVPGARHALWQEWGGGIFWHTRVI